MNEVIKQNLEQVAADMIVSAIKSVARHNKRAAELLNKTKNWANELNDHNSFLSDLINILSPVIGIVHSFLEKIFPAYVHIADWIYELLNDIAKGLA